MLGSRFEYALPKSQSHLALSRLVFELREIPERLTMSSPGIRQVDEIKYRCRTCVGMLIVYLFFFPATHDGLCPICDWNEDKIFCR